MSESKRVKIVVYVPEQNADDVRLAIGESGAGVIGNYGYCCFVSRGTGHFLPLDGANPSIGKVGQIESVSEAKIEFECKKDMVSKVVDAIIKSHPYEEVPIDIFPLLEFSDFA
jgi:hypothetical protein